MNTFTWCGSAACDVAIVVQRIGVVLVHYSFERFVIVQYHCLLGVVVQHVM